jgi:hypothetical protein
MSAIDLTGESARTYQYESSPVDSADDAHRRALGVGAHDAERAGGNADVDAAGDHRLHRLAAAAGEQQLEVELVLAENAGALAQRGRRAVPYFTLTDRDLELVRGRCRSGCEPPRDGGGETNAGSLDHGGLPRARRGRGTCGNLRPRHRPRKRSGCRARARRGSGGQAGASGRNFKATPLMQ